MRVWLCNSNRKSFHWLPKKANITMTSINTVCLSSALLEVIRREGEHKLCFLFLSAGFPFTTPAKHLVESRIRSNLCKQQTSPKTYRPWQVISDSLWLTRASLRVSTNCKLWTDNESKGRLWHCQRTGSNALSTHFHQGLRFGRSKGLNCEMAQSQLWFFGWPISKTGPLFCRENLR